MQILIREEIKNIQVTSVIVSHDQDDPHGYRLHMFFCYNCQAPVFQYKGSVVHILPGEVPMELPIIHQCPNCKKNYAIHAIV